jgi:hypothetical protein
LFVCGYPDFQITAEKIVPYPLKGLGTLFKINK